MRNWKRTLFHVLSSLLAVQLFMAGAEATTCEIQKFPAETGLQDRAAVVEFPDGRRISVIGHNHGSRALPRRLDDLTVTTDAKKIKRRLFSAQQANSEALEHAEIDVQYFQNIGKFEPETSFIAIETTDRNIDHVQRNAAIDLDNASSLYQAAGLSLVRAEKMARVLAGVPVYLSQTVPQFPYEIVGVESPEALAMHKQKTDLFEKARAQLKQVNDVKTRVKAYHLILEMNAAYSAGTFDGHSQLRSLSEIVSRQVAKDHQKPVTDFLLAHMGQIEALQARDKANARNLVQKRATGTFLVGESHLNHTMKLLREACLQESSAPRKQKTLRKTVGVR